jgi:hypothetical protein
MTPRVTKTGEEASPAAAREQDHSAKANAAEGNRVLIIRF